MARWRPNVVLLTREEIASGRIQLVGMIMAVVSVWEMLPFFKGSCNVGILMTRRGLSSHSRQAAEALEG